MREVRIDDRIGQLQLEASAGTDAHAAAAIVESPVNTRWGELPGVPVALVGVDRTAVDRHGLRRVGEETTERMLGGLGDVQFAPIRLGKGVLPVLPKRQVVMAAIAHDADLGLRHERDLNPELSRHLYADLAVRQQAIGSPVGTVVHEIQFDLPSILVVSLDHVDPHREGVADHTLVDLAGQLERAGVVRRAHAGAGDRVVPLALPGHLRLRATA